MIERCKMYEKVKANKVTMSTHALRMMSRTYKLRRFALVILCNHLTMS